ncbi:MAG: hypothetical protein JWO36_6985 [Myxococcales bacterium]|nr:hypothetical protein [Myxococcales bacterium]
MGRWIAFIFALAGCATAARPDLSGDAKNGSNQPIDAPITQIDANTCATQPCDILTQCGCGMGMACDVDTTDLMGTACRMLTTPGHETNTCGSLKDCDRGYVCLGAAGSSTCKKYCSSSSDCGTPRGQCVIDVSNGTMVIPGIPSVCSSNCDPINTAIGGCPGGFKCGLFTQPHQSMTYGIVDCTLAGTLTQGANCAGAGSGDDKLCAPNFLCTQLGTTPVTYKCLKVCNKTANTGCVAAAPTCGGFGTPFLVAGTEYGVCQ